MAVAVQSSHKFAMVVQEASTQASCPPRGWKGAQEKLQCAPLWAAEARFFEDLSV